MVKVYVSIFGDKRGREVAMAGLKSKAKYARGVLGKRMKLRLTPEIRFIEDESQERGSRVCILTSQVFTIRHFMKSISIVRQNEKLSFRTSVEGHPFCLSMIRSNIFSL